MPRLKRTDYLLVKLDETNLLALYIGLIPSNAYIPYTKSMSYFRGNCACFLSHSTFPAHTLAPPPTRSLMASNHKPRLCPYMVTAGWTNHLTDTAIITPLTLLSTIIKDFRICNRVMYAYIANIKLYYLLN